MKNNVTLPALVLWACALLLAPALYSAPIPESLRGGIECDQDTINQALELQADGWEYVMPRPKSGQAAWGNYDGRTTWWNGYWMNRTTKETSGGMPTLKDGKYVGDKRPAGGWRRGGSPRSPTKIEWLLSQSGGVKPR